MLKFVSGFVWFFFFALFSRLNLEHYSSEDLLATRTRTSLTHHLAVSHMVTEWQVTFTLWILLLPSIKGLIASLQKVITKNKSQVTKSMKLFASKNPLNQTCARAFSLITFLLSRPISRWGPRVCSPLTPAADFTCTHSATEGRVITEIRRHGDWMRRKTCGL